MLQVLNEYLEVSDTSTTGLRWKVKPSRSIAKGAIALTNEKDGYHQGKVKGKQYYAHRVVFYLVHGYMPCEVDHIDGNRTNNSPENLRDASRGQNMQNVVAKGYSFDKGTGLYRARVYLDGKEIYLGSYQTEAAARDAYLAGKERHHPYSTKRCLGGEVEQT